MERDIIWYIPTGRMTEILDVVKYCPDCLPTPDPGPEKNIAAVLSRVNACVVPTDMGDLSKTFVQTSHSFHAMVFTDEAKGTEAEWTQILDWGTDGIQTDNPEKLITWLKNLKR